MKIHLIFHVWLLHPHNANLIDRQKVLSYELAEIYEDSATEYPADEVVDSRVIK